MTTDLKLVVGLGNPGAKYAGTRHNIGFMALELLGERSGFSFRQQAKLHGLAADTGVGEQRLRLLMPQTYMNDSGRAIRAALDWFGLEPHQLLVLVDDMDLPLGRLRLRAQGSAGGHNGLRSTFSISGLRRFPGCGLALVRRPRILLSVALERCPMFLARSARWNNLVSALFLMLFWTGFNVFSARALSVLEPGSTAFAMTWSRSTDAGAPGDNGPFAGAPPVFSSQMRGG